MKASGRNNPCPVCSRVKDADCRWSDEVILCHTGTDLNPGNTITINGVEWAFIHHNGGFSGSAAVFKPHRERSREEWKRGLQRPTPNTPQELAALQISSSQWSNVLDHFFAAFDAAWNVPDFYSSKPDELKASFAAINDAQAKAVGLSRHLQSIWHEHPDLKQRHKLRVDHCMKCIAHMAEDARQFQQNELGMPCPVAVRAIAEGL